MQQGRLMTALLTAWVGGILALSGSSAAAEATFAGKPAAVREGEAVKIRFALSAPTDVEVAVLAADGTVVRHLAAGVLGGAQPPPEPLKPGLTQDLAWDGRDDFQAAARGGPFTVRVRAGMGVAFSRFLGGSPYHFGALDRLTADEEGRVYIMGFSGGANQGHMVLRVFDAEGRYLRELMPFPADLAPGAMKEIAAWDDEAVCWRPRNLRNLNPAFYPQPGSDNVAHFPLTLVSASQKNGILLTDGARTYRLAVDGSVPGPTFALGDLWPQDGRLPNSGGGPLFLRASPDGRHLYLSGPFSAKTYTGYEYDARFPPGQVYRMEIGKGTMTPFVRLATAMKMPPFRDRSGLAPPLADVAIDRDGSVLVADQEHGAIVVFDGAGKELGRMAVERPEQIAVHPRTGAVYVLAGAAGARAAAGQTLIKFASWKEARRSAELALGATGGMPQMALAAGEAATTIWLGGLRGGLAAFDDAGDAFRPKTLAFAPRAEHPADWTRLTTDYARDEVYISNGTTGMWRYSGQTGEGTVLKKDGKPFLANDLAVGYDGHLWVRVSCQQLGASPASAYSGPFWKLDRDLNPVALPGTRTHVLSPYIYSRYGVGFAERGLGVGPKGEAYCSFMYKWVAYALGGWGPDGRPLKGRYLEGTFPGKGEYPPDLTSAVVGPIPQAHGGVRVDLAGNLYLGVLYWPSGAARPTGREKDEGYVNSVGSVIKFPADGGRFPGAEAPMRADAVEGALAVYPGLAPFSRSGWGGNTCCVCRTPRFDLDPYGRLVLPNAFTNSVSVVDNTGNRIVEFGKYGNFDSRYVNPDAAGESRGRPTVAGPEIPLAWPTGAGFTEKHLYVLDTYNRRALQLAPTWRAEETCGVN